MNRREVLLALGVGSLAAFTDSLAASRYRDAEPPSLFLHACALDSVIGLLLATDIGRHQTRPPVVGAGSACRNSASALSCMAGPL